MLVGWNADCQVESSADKQAVPSFLAAGELHDTPHRFALVAGRGVASSAAVDAPAHQPMLSRHRRGVVLDAHPGHPMPVQSHPARRHGENPFITPNRGPRFRREPAGVAQTSAQAVAALQIDVGVAQVTRTSILSAAIQSAFEFPRVRTAHLNRVRSRVQT